MCVQCSIPCTSSHFWSEAARTNPSKLPRGCRPCPPQFAAESSGVLTFDQSGMRERQYSSLASGFFPQSSKNSRRLAPSSSSVSVSGPDTQSPVIRLRQPLVPRPCCTLTTCEGNQVLPKVHRMPP